MFVLVLLRAATVNAGDPHSPAIIYPQLDPPFDKVVDLTISGIKEIIPAAEKHGYKEVIVSAQHPILLTNKAIRDYQSAFSDNTEFVAGLAEIRLSKPIYGVSFFIDPAAYVKQIAAISDQINRVVFFYNDLRSDPPILENLNSETNYEFRSASANNTEDALKAFAGENGSASAKTAFVFTRGFIEINTNILLDFVLSESWKTGAVTLGNKASYVKAGMTIGLLPDFIAYGEQLAQLLIAAKEEKYSSPRVLYLKTDVNAINVRTAIRSNIFATEQLKRKFKYSYPAK